MLPERWKRPLRSVVNSLPPVMGAGAFIMAERTELPYSHIALISVAPALLYFFAVWVMVHLEAKKWNIQGLPKGRFASALAILLKRQWYCIDSFVNTCCNTDLRVPRHPKRRSFAILATIGRELYSTGDTPHSETIVGSNGFGGAQFVGDWRRGGDALALSSLLSI